MEMYVIALIRKGASSMSPTYHWTFVWLDLMTSAETPGVGMVTFLSRPGWMSLKDIGWHFVLTSFSAKTETDIKPMTKVMVKTKYLTNLKSRRMCQLLINFNDKKILIWEAWFHIRECCRRCELLVRCQLNVILLKKVKKVRNGVPK